MSRMDNQCMWMRDELDTSDRRGRRVMTLPIPHGCAAAGRGITVRMDELDSALGSVRLRMVDQIDVESVGQSHQRHAPSFAFPFKLLEALIQNHAVASPTGRQRLAMMLLYVGDGVPSPAIP